MKKILLKVGLFSIFILGGYISASAQHFYVKIRPKSVVIARPVRPHTNYIWIAPEWRWHNGTYVTVPGYWTAPVVGKRWVPGYWRRTRHGHEWVRGHWVIVRK